MRIAWWGSLLVMVVLSVCPSTSSGQTKYDPMFGKALAAANARHQPRRWLDCVIRLAHPPHDADMADLRATGFKPRSVVGTIVTGRIQAGDADQLIASPLVASIEGGGVGGRKKTRGMK